MFLLSSHGLGSRWNFLSLHCVGCLLASLSAVGSPSKVSERGLAADRNKLSVHPSIHPCFFLFYFSIFFPSHAALSLPKTNERIGRLGVPGIGTFKQLRFSIRRVKNSRYFSASSVALICGSIFHWMTCFFPIPCMDIGGEWTSKKLKPSSSHLATVIATG